MHYELIVLSRLLPSFKVHSEAIVSFSSHLPQVEPECAESYTQQLLFCLCLRQNVISTLGSKCHAIILPCLEGSGQLVWIWFPDKLLASLPSKPLIGNIVFPHLESSLHILSTIFCLRIPNSLECFILRTVQIFRVQLSRSPMIEHFTQ